MQESATLAPQLTAHVTVDQPPSRVVRLRLFSGLIALGFLVVALYAYQAYAARVEADYIHALAPLKLSQKLQGSALQRAAFEQSDLLPLYGASEIRTGGAFRPIAVFAHYPTGFQIFTVAKPRVNALIMLQELSAVGADLRGKKLVIFTSPDYFLDPMIPADAYAGLYSPLHANALVFSTDLSMDLKRQAARRMLDYPATLQRDPLLAFAVARLADDSLWSEALYYAVLPLGKLHALILTWQDHWEALKYIWGNPTLNVGVTRQPAPLDWAALSAAATQAHRANATNNRFGIENQFWDQYLPIWANARDTLTDATYRDRIEKSDEWVDLDLLLQTLKQLGAEPLLLSLPIHAQYYSYRGVSIAGRQLYYQKLHALAQAYGVPVVDFAEHDEDRDFFADAFGHPSALGWVYYDEVIDHFYHGSLDGARAATR